MASTAVRNRRTIREPHSHGMNVPGIPTDDQDRAIAELMTEHAEASITMFVCPRSLSRVYYCQLMASVYADDGQGVYVVAPDGRVIA